MFIRICSFFVLIEFVICISNQEDLSISNYSHIGCLVLNSNKQYIFDTIQENSSLPYQTYSSRNLTIELCFRLCRRWMILLNHNHTNCICLYTMNELYELNEHLGEIMPINKCKSNTFEIYSLTQDPYLLPALSSNDDWSFEGCYYLHGIQKDHASTSFNYTTHTQAIHLCRQHCQLTRSPVYFSYFISLKKYCYCLPIKISSSTTTIAVRKPLIHCSFLSYIKTAFTNSFNYSEINTDTVIKINVQRHCSPTFIFQRNLYLCFKTVSSDRLNTYSKIAPNDTCRPLLIKTAEQWNYLLSANVFSPSITFVWIDWNSTYIFDDLLKIRTDTLTWNNVCLMVNQNRLISYDVVPCSTVRSLASVLCTQKPFESVASEHADFKSTGKKPIADNLSCPSGFILFNKICYYVDTSFVYSIRQGEQLCTEKYFNSSLVKFASHEWGNINSTRFLGRTIEDSLLEFFYYQLEQRFIAENKNDSTKKHWLRLLIGDKNNLNECVVRYFIRSSSAFTILHKCQHGGHPVCQTQPMIINQSIESIITNQSTLSAASSSTTTTTTTTTTTIEIILLNTTISSNETVVRARENWTNLTSDDDIFNNETNMNDVYDNNKTDTLIRVQKSGSNYRLLFGIITGPAIALLILLIAIVFLIRYCRRSHGSYSTRTKNKTTPTSKTTSDTPAVLYSRLKPSQTSSTMDSDMTNTFDNLVTSDDYVQLLPKTSNQTNLQKNIIVEDEEEAIYATVKQSNEKESIS